MDTLPIENIVPEALRELDTDEFMRQLPSADAHFEEMKKNAAKDGNVLRYIGMIDVTTGNCQVELKGLVFNSFVFIFYIQNLSHFNPFLLISYPLSHPFASLKGSDNIISFQTERFDPQPLIIQGPGAGAAVTAFGIFSDILKI